MQKEVVRTSALLLGALTCNLVMMAQTQAPSKTTSPRETSPVETNVAVLFSSERGQIAQTGSPTFWLTGGSGEVAITFWKGFGVAGNITGEHSSNVANNVPFSEVAFMGGPRYTFNKHHRLEFFGEGLFGRVHAFNSFFPAANGIVTDGNGLYMQAGGGMDAGLARGFGLRVFEADWVHTNLPNNAANTQNDLRVAFGLSFRR